MPRGGYRPGAGRPKGTGKAATVAPARAAQVPAPVGKRQTPLEYMLDVLNDASADAARRDRMAIAAAAFVHEKPGDGPQGKKERAAEEAKTAGLGTDWGDDLTSPMN